MADLHCSSGVCLARSFVSGQLPAGITERGYFRLVSKFTAVEPFLNLEHRGHTRFRFSINAPEIIERYEKHTPALPERLAAAGKVISAGYPTGFLLAPLFLDDGWRERYRRLLQELQRRLPRPAQPFTFELITHRFTRRARRNIEAIFPDADLDMAEERRRRDALRWYNSAHLAEK